MIDIHEDRYGRAIFHFGGHAFAAFAEKSSLLPTTRVVAARKKGHSRVDIGRSEPIFSCSSQRRPAANRRKLQVPALFAARDER
jgi:hypothetical protein